MHSIVIYWQHEVSEMSHSQVNTNLQARRHLQQRLHHPLGSINVTGHVLAAEGLLQGESTGLRGKKGGRRKGEGRAAAPPSPPPADQRYRTCSGG